MVDKGELERQGAVEVVQERTPPAENGRLILGRRNGIVDVLIGDGFGVVAVPHPANAVFQHFQVGNGLLGGEGRPALTPCGAVFGSLIFLQSVPPFPPVRQRARTGFPSGRASRRGAGAWPGQCSAPPFQRAGRPFRTSP